MKLSFGERLSYALGDFSNNGAYMFVGTFLITFLTIGMGLSGKVAGAIIMAVTIFDAINDVIIGSIVDKAHGRGVKYTTFLRFSVLPMAVLMVLLFFSPQFSLTGKLVYSLVIYSIYTIAQTSFQVPYGSLSGAMTDSSEERITLGAFRDWGSNLGGFLINTFASVLILHFGGGEMNARGFFISALLIGVLLVIGGCFPAFLCKERVPVVASQQGKLLEGLKSFVKNRNAVVATLVVCLVNCGIMARASLTTYYAPYYLGDANLIAPILSVMSVVPLVAILFVPTLTKKLDRKVMYCMAGVSMVLAGAVESLGGSLATSIISSILCGFTLCCSITVTWGAIPDIADYGEYMTGTFNPGTIYSTLTFVMKLATAFSSMGLGLILDGYGFSAGQVTETAVNGIRLWYGLIPVILGIIVLVVALFFNLTHKKLEEVHQALAQRRG